MEPIKSPMRTAKPEVVRVWGKADGLDIEFEKRGGKWLCLVPPDTKDGQYACEINAYNAAGKTAFYAGILYMCSGVCHLQINTKSAKLDGSKYAVFVRSKHEIIIRKGCRHV